MTASAWENAPWMVGGGVEHEVELARLLAFGAFNGLEGIVRPDHLKVSASTPTAASVRVSPGACAVLNRSAAAESYIARLPTFDNNIAIAPTGTGSGRSDLVIARIEDPFQAGNPWPVPTDAAKQTTQYVRTVVIPNVPADTTTLIGAGVSYSAIPLARIDVPANTSIILPAHITDLRRLYAANAMPGIDDLVKPSAKELTPNTATFATWPSAVNNSVYIPEWATHFKCRLLLGQVAWGDAGNNGGAGWSAAGSIVVRLGGGTDSPPIAYSVDSDTGVDRGAIIAGAARMAIPLSLRGTVQDFRVRANKTSGSTRMYVDEKSLLSVELDWLELPE